VPDDGSVDPEIKYLQEKTRKGASNIVGEILKDPSVQNAIKSALLAETIKNSIVMACLLVGLLKLYDVSKAIMGFDWRGDLATSIGLISVGLIYLTKNMLSLKKNGHPAPNRSNTDDG
jgi:hypothetical protein